jgi:two-component system NtrC family response regulator/two-component system response regulator HydG
MAWMSAPEEDTRPFVLLALRDAQEAEGLVPFLERHGFAVEITSDGEATLNALDSASPHAVVADYGLQRIHGLRLLKIFLNRIPRLCFVLISDRHDVDLAAEAIRSGAQDVQVRPIDRERLLMVLNRGASIIDLHRRVDRLEHRLDKKFGFDNLVGNSAPMVEILEKIRQIAPTRATVLITGETGTGKELVASAIHYNSARSDQPFVKLNCAALSEGVIESELFGHERGAFTGAVRTRKGRFEIAAGGTLFLDEISEVTPPIQAKLLRVLQEREFERVGGSKTVRVDVRLIAATNRNLEAEVRSGRFREDLYYRLNVVTINIPPLRRRREDLPLLVEAFLREMADEHGKTVAGVTKGALDILMSHTWPGNVRELKNTIEGMVLFASPGQSLGVDDLPELLRAGASEDAEQLSLRVGMTMAEMEKRMIEATYRACGRDKRRTASTLGIGLRTLYRKLKEYEL